MTLMLDTSLLAMDMITAEHQSPDLAQSKGMHLEKPHQPRRGLGKRKPSSPREKSED